MIRARRFRASMVAAAIGPLTLVLPGAAPAVAAPPPPVAVPGQAQVATVVMAAEDLGGADRCVQMGVGYAQEREAFGRRIGSYQAVKHTLVDAWVGVEQLRSLVWWAA